MSSLKQPWQDAAEINAKPGYFGYKFLHLDAPVHKFSLYFWPPYIWYLCIWFQGISRIVMWGMRSKLSFGSSQWPKFQCFCLESATYINPLVGKLSRTTFLLTSSRSHSWQETPRNVVSSWNKVIWCGLSVWFLHLFSQRLSKNAFRENLHGPKQVNYIIRLKTPEPRIIFIP